jgi:hypothetical protein
MLRIGRLNLLHKSLRTNRLQQRERGKNIAQRSGANCAYHGGKTGFTLGHGGRYQQANCGRRPTCSKQRVRDPVVRFCTAQFVNLPQASPGLLRRDRWGLGAHSEDADHDSGMMPIGTANRHAVGMGVTRPVDAEGKSRE